MSYYDGFAPVYTFHACVMREDRTLLDVAITARGSADGLEIKNAKRSINRLLDECVPEIKMPPVYEVAEAPPDAVTPEPEEQPAPERQPEGAEKPESAPTQKDEDAEKEAAKESHFEPGIKGSVYMKCPECGNKFHAVLKERQKSLPFKCGHVIDLTDPNITRYEYKCPACGWHNFGHTNIEDAEYTETCVCGERIEMAWNKRLRRYTSKDMLERGARP